MPRLTDADRDRLRELQDRWLAARASRYRGLHENAPLFAGGPSLRDVRECICPEWEWWFKDGLERGD